MRFICNMLFMISIVAAFTPLAIICWHIQPHMYHVLIGFGGLIGIFLTLMLAKNRPANKEYLGDE